MKTKDTKQIGDDENSMSKEGRGRGRRRRMERVEGEKNGGLAVVRKVSLALGRECCRERATGLG
jgi:hypothetical protein